MYGPDATAMAAHIRIQTLQIHYYQPHNTLNNFVLSYDVKVSDHKIGRRLVESP